VNGSLSLRTFFEAADKDAIALCTRFVIGYGHVVIEKQLEKV